jgi:hypothetical protein
VRRLAEKRVEEVKSSLKLKGVHQLSKGNVALAEAKALRDKRLHKGE